MKSLPQHITQQKLLFKKGFYKGAIDGKWGYMSRTAMQQYCDSIGVTWVRVDRSYSDSDHTISRIYINGVFQAHGLEDEYREDKVPAETRIPAGHYSLEVRTVGGFHNRYLRMFGKEHRGMLWVRNVPNFKYILIHIGNYVKDTAGCLLVGRADYKAKTVWQSKTVYKKLYKKLIVQATAKECIITYEDNDNPRK